MQNYKTKALVTGHMGFIGSHLSTRLNELDFEVVGADIKSGNPVDIRDFNKLNDLCKGADVIFHLAAISSNKECEANPSEAVSVNMDGTETVFRVAKENKCTVLVASSAAVYGPVATLCSEDMQTNPHGVYASTKKQSEIIANKYSGSVYSVCTRLFNVYGPGGHGVINKFIDPYPKSRIEVTGPGEQIRDFIYVDDVIKAIIGIYNNLLAKRGAYNYNSRSQHIYNIGTGSGVSINAVANCIQGLKGLNPRHRYASQEDPGYMYSVANISRIKEIIPDFMPINILMGLDKLI